MEMYFAGMRFNTQTSTEDQIAINKFMIENEVNYLLSYVNDKKQIMECFNSNFKGKLFIDSGAYSVWTRGKKIDVSEYIDFLNTYDNKIHIFAQVDIIPGIKHKVATMQQVNAAAQDTWRNYLFMRDKLKSPEKCLYTFHLGEPIKYLKQALEWRDENGQPIPYIALGGMVGKPTPVRKAFLDSCFKIIEKSSNPNVKTHAFGMTRFSLLEKYPITSADSTTWLKAGINGEIMTDKGRIVVSDRKSKSPEHYSHLPKHLQKAFEESIAEFGFTLDELKESSDKRIMFNVQYINKKARVLQYLPGPKKLSLF